MNNNEVQNAVTKAIMKSQEIHDQDIKWLKEELTELKTILYYAIEKLGGELIIPDTTLKYYRSSPKFESYRDERNRSVVVRTLKNDKS